MTTRIIVGLLALPFVIIPIWVGGFWCTLLLLIVALLGGWELYQLMEMGGHHPATLLGLLWIASFVLQAWQPQILPFGSLLTIGLILMLLYSLTRTEGALETWAYTTAGAIYLGGLAGHTLALRLLPDGLWWFLLGLLAGWANDTAAYFTGVSLGNHKIWPRWSPKKSWEGTIGGWCAAVLLGGVVAWLSPLPISIPFGMGLGFVCGVLALFGDLVESMIKRQVGVKDSGGLFPGHGGMLDRIDSLLFILPVLYQIVLLLE